MNKKLKKKSIPECNDAYKEALVQKVLDAEVVYEWECILKDRTKTLMTSMIAILGGAVSFAAIQDAPEGWLVAGVVVVMSLASYFLFYADQDYLCQITPYGIRSYETERVPEACYKFMRGSAYVGIVVCVIAVIFVGPMAFVGAGGSALMAFQMRRFHKNTEIIVKPFDNNGIYEYNPDYHTPEESCYKNGITLYDYVIPEYVKNGDENLTALKNFHWISFYCTKELYPEVHDVITQYITARLEKDEEEEAVTE